MFIPVMNGVNARRSLENKLDSNIECGRTRSSTVPPIEQFVHEVLDKASLYSSVMI
jgi:hypothetical protein